MSMIINPFMFAPPAVASVAFQASTTSTATSTITAPASIEPGDILVMVDAGSGFGPPTKVVPAGFTEVPGSELVIGAKRVVLSYKIATGSEDGATITGMSTSPSNKIILQFRPNVPATAITPASVNAQATDADPTAQNVTASGGTPPLIVIATYGASAAVDPRTMSPAKDAEVASSTLQYIAYKIYNAAPADVSVDMDDEGTGNCLQSCYLAIV
jgi:hypothetical protein